MTFYSRNNKQERVLVNPTNQCCHTYVDLLFVEYVYAVLELTIDDGGWAGITKRGVPKTPPPELAVANPVDAERFNPLMPGAFGP